MISDFRAQNSAIAPVLYLAQAIAPRESGLIVRIQALWNSTALLRSSNGTDG
jgi:hypothetical protein